MNQVEVGLFPIGKLKQLSNIAELCRNKTAVLLGESTHGTQEFYHYRSLLTKHLLPMGFRYVFFEADWEVIRPLNQYIHGQASFQTCVSSMKRVDKYPIWMVKNQSICDMLHWMRRYNLKNGYRRLADGVVFMGLDCYDMKYSWETIQSFYKNKDNKTYQSIHQKLKHYDLTDTHSYGESNQNNHHIFQLLNTLKRQLLPKNNSKNTSYHWKRLNVIQAIQSMIGADRYFRSLYSGKPQELHLQSWSHRDRHWLEMVKNIELYHRWNNPTTPFRFILWAHNSHIGDSAGEIAQQHHNIGEYTRLYFGKEKTFLLGFTTYEGRVRASRAWDSPSRMYQLEKPEKDTYSYIFHQLVPQIGKQYAILLSSSLQNKYRKLQKKSNRYPTLQMRHIIDTHHQRSIGVIYQPEHERESHYHEGRIQDKYDMLIHIDRTNAISLL